MAPFFRNSQTPLNTNSQTRSWLDRIKADITSESAVWTLTCFIAILILTPWERGFYGISLDMSWGNVLHHAFGSSWQFGRDIVFTYGPFGFLLVPAYDPGTHGAMLVYWILIAITLHASIWDSIGQVTHRIAPRVFCVIAVCCSMNSTWSFSPILFPFLLLLHSIHGERTNARAGISALLIMTNAILSLAKFTIFFAAFWVVCVLTVDALGRKRKPWLFAGYVGAIAIAWLLASQSLTNLFAYFRISFELASGYNEAVASSGPIDEAVSFLALEGVLLLLVIVIEFARSARTGLIAAAGAGGLLFLNFKSGFVRHDIHASCAMLALFEICMVYCTLSLFAAKTKLPIWLGAVTFVCSIWLVSSLYAQYFGTRFFPALLRPLTELPKSLVLARNAIFRSDERKEEFKQFQKALCNQFELPEMNGSTDYYSYKQSIVLAHGWRYQPRPIFQSYLAYTESLARLNAEFLKSDKAPENILFEIMPIDGRLPALDDGLSWPELLSRYDFVKSIDTISILRKSDAPRTWKKDLIEETTVSFGQPAKIPTADGGLIWAEADIEKTWANAFIGFLWKPKSIMATLNTADASETYRVITGLLRAGFLISPRVASSSDLFSLIGNRDASTSLPQVRSISFSVSNGSAALFYGPDIRIRFYRLMLQGRTVGNVQNSGDGK